MIPNGMIADQMALVWWLQDRVSDPEISESHRARARKMLEEEDVVLAELFAAWEEETGR